MDQRSQSLKGESILAQSGEQLVLPGVLLWPGGTLARPLLHQRHLSVLWQVPTFSGPDHVAKREPLLTTT